MYLKFSAGYLLLIGLLDYCLSTQVWRRRLFWQLLGVMLLLTLIFNMVLTSLPIVHYDQSKILGWRLGSIPLEDFGYSLGMVWLILMLRAKWAKS